MEQPAERFLFRRNTYTYVILDGASVPDLQVKLNETKPQSVCLYRGELTPDLAYVAPYLVHLAPQSDFTKWVLAECWGKHWGIFVQSVSTITSMRKHFRSLLTVYDETGKPLLFRFYDPRVLLNFMPTCNGEELDAFFGKVNYYFAESEDAATLYRFSFAENALKKINLNMLEG